MIKRKRDFCSADRYVYDFTYCTVAKGWAQVDTKEDAHYYGTWANPEKGFIFNYAEGDLSLTMCDTPQEFVAEMRSLQDWAQKQGIWKGVDCGLSANLEAWFRLMGLGDLLH